MRNIAIFASGRGSNFKAIFQHIQRGEIPATVVCLISDNPGAKALDFAVANRIPQFVIPPKAFATPREFGRELLNVLTRQRAEWIVLAGYLKKIPDEVVRRYRNRIVNIHPALLPAFGGKGMYGMRVHQAVFNSGARISGVTVHLVNSEYDAGPIVAQEAVSLEDCAGPEQIAEKVLEAEHRLYPRTLKKLLTTGFSVMGNRVIFEENK